MGEYLPFNKAQEGIAEALVRVADHVSTQLRAGAIRSLGPIKNPLFFGMGATYAVLGLPVFELRQAGIGAGRCYASEVFPTVVPQQYDAIIAASVEGRSVETIEALVGVDLDRRIAVLNVTGTPLAKVASAVVNTGDELDSMATTIGYCSMAMALSMVAHDIMGVDSRPQWDGIDQYVRLGQDLGTALAERISAPLAQVGAADFVASLACASSADAGGLFFREIARVPSSVLTTRNYLHGEMESAGNTLHVIYGDDRELPMAAKLASRGHTTVLITTADVPEAENLFPVKLPTVPLGVRAVMEAVILQKLCTQAAALRGLDPDEFLYEEQDTKDKS